MPACLSASVITLHTAVLTIIVTITTAVNATVAVAAGVFFLTADSSAAVSTAAYADSFQAAFSSAGVLLCNSRVSSRIKVGSDYRRGVAAAAGGG